MVWKTTTPHNIARRRGKHEIHHGSPSIWPAWHQTCCRTLSSQFRRGAKERCQLHAGASTSQWSSR
eukprot:7674598-Alexandrium_andersonii.AAC.1